MGRQSGPKRPRYILYHGAVGGNTINAIEVGNQTTATVTNLIGAQQISFLWSPLTLNWCQCAFGGCADHSPRHFLAAQHLGHRRPGYRREFRHRPLPFTISDAQLPQACSLFRDVFESGFGPESNIIFGGSNSTGP